MKKIAAILLFLVAQAATASALFSSESPLDIEINSDFPYRSFSSNSPNKEDLQKEYLGQVKFTLENTKYSVASKIEARGSGRLSHCDFAPFKIKVKKKIEENPLLDADLNYKIVTHCLEGSDERSLKADEFLLKEYLMYKILERSGIDSYKTRLLKIKYTNSQNEVVANRLAFIIESNEDFKKRNSITTAELDEEGVKSFFEDLTKKFTQQKELFNKLSSLINYENLVQNRIGQLMILNADWGESTFSSSGNTKAFLLPSQTIMSVHYDFDLSFFVGKFEQSSRMNYAYPVSCASDKTWIDRFLNEQDNGYVQVSQKKIAFDQVIKKIINQRSHVLSYLNEFNMLTASSKQEIINRLEVFYSCFE